MPTHRAASTRRIQRGGYSGSVTTGPLDVDTVAPTRAGARPCVGEVVADGRGSPRAPSYWRWPRGSGRSCRFPLCLGCSSRGSVGGVERRTAVVGLRVSGTGEVFPTPAPRAPANRHANRIKIVQLFVHNVLHVFDRRPELVIGWARNPFAALAPVRKAPLAIVLNVDGSVTASDLRGPDHNLASRSPRLPGFGFSKRP